MGGDIISELGGGIIPLQGGAIIPELGGGFLRNQQAGSAPKRLPRPTSRSLSILRRVRGMRRITSARNGLTNTKASSITAGTSSAR